MRVEVEVDLVNVSRRPEAVPSVVDQAVGCGVGATRLQLGVGRQMAVARARSSGLEVVSGRWLEVDHAARRAALERRR